MYFAAAISPPHSASNFSALVAFHQSGVVSSECANFVFSLELIGVSLYPFIHQKIKVVQFSLVFIYTL